jgi:hypothetical protein
VAWRRQVRYLVSLRQESGGPVKIDDDGNMELTADENQDLMDRLDIAVSDYDDPPVAIEGIEFTEELARFRATNTRTGKTVVLTFDRSPPD